MPLSHTLMCPHSVLPMVTLLRVYLRWRWQEGRKGWRHVWTDDQSKRIFFQRESECSKRVLHAVYSFWGELPRAWCQGLTRWYIYIPYSSGSGEKSEWGVIAPLKELRLGTSLVPMTTWCFLKTGRSCWSVRKTACQAFTSEHPVLPHSSPAREWCFHFHMLPMGDYDP